MIDIHMAFESLNSDPAKAENLLGCADLVASHDVSAPWPRFSESALRWWLNQAGYSVIDHQLPDRPQRYVYASSTFSGPWFWAGWPGNDHGFASLFDHIPQAVMDDLVDGRALLLLDQMMEGYSDARLWSFFHDEMDRWNLPRNSILYWSGNYRESEAYAAWCREFDEPQRLQVGSLPHLEMVSQNQIKKSQYTSWSQQIMRRASMPLPPRLFNCMNRAPRYHRDIMFMELHQAGLLPHGLVSMPGLNWEWQYAENRYYRQSVDSALALLPMRLDLPDFQCNPAFDVNPRLYDNSYISLITETLADDGKHSLFITEKVFKCMSQSHPFMVLGQRGYLRQLREWGYETFHDFWDESYDELPDMHDRASAIAGQLRHLSANADLVTMVEEMRDILQHNFDLFVSKTCRCPDIAALAQRLMAHTRGN